jgi:hypothetical protein
VKGTKRQGDETARGRNGKGTKRPGRNGKGTKREGDETARGRNGKGTKRPVTSVMYVTNSPLENKCGSAYDP